MSADGVPPTRFPLEQSSKVPPTLFFFSQKFFYVDSGRASRCAFLFKSLHLQVLLLSLAFPFMPADASNMKIICHPHVFVSQPCRVVFFTKKPPHCIAALDLRCLFASESRVAWCFNVVYAAKFPLLRWSL